MESLEPRQHLAITLEGRTLVVTGTAGADRVTIETRTSSPYGVRIGLNAQLKVVDVTTIDLIRINLGDGNDAMTTNTAAVPMTIRLAIDGGAGNDRLAGADGSDTIRGGPGDDFIIDGAGNDRLYGGDGADQLVSGFGGDFVYGEAGNDKITTDATNNSIPDSLDGGDGNDAIILTYGRATLAGGNGNDTLTSNVTVGTTFLGGNGDDSLVGGAGPDMMAGGTGKDTLKGNAGNDTLWGGEDDDQLVGGTEFDEFHGGSGNDALRSIDTVVGELVDGGDGTDTAYVDLSLLNKPTDSIKSLEKIIYPLST